jgi:hypothetical protein
MKAQTVRLRVLGTCDYYQKQKDKPTGPSLQLQHAISQSLDHFVSASLPEFKMDFGFDDFPENFYWSLADKENDKKILEALREIQPLFNKPADDRLQRAEMPTTPLLLPTLNLRSK